MTRTTLRALWFGGGGVVATWLAVAPTPSAPEANAANMQRAAATAAEVKAADLDALAKLLRERTNTIAMRPSTRNLFAFKSSKPLRSPAERDAEQAFVPAAPPTPPAPQPALAGIAQNGTVRTAIITLGSQIYLVSDGASVGDQYTVVTVDAEAVLLRDASGAELRLILR